MGYIIIIVCGLIGAGSALKKKFLTCWIFLINVCFSLYLAIFLAPVLAPLLEIPGLDDGYKSAIAVGGIFLLVNYILKIIAGQIISNPENDFKLPPISQLFSIAAGFLSGCMIVGLLLYCFIQTPVVNGFSQKKELRSAARKTLMGVVHTVNAFSFQSLTPEAETEMQSIRLLPKKKVPPPAKANQQKPEDPKNQNDPKNKPGDENVKKDSSKAPAKAADKPEETKKAEKTAPTAQS